MDWKPVIEENFKVGLVDLMILKSISVKDMYGYEIMLMMSEKTNDKFQIREGSLYGPLYRLQNKGLITSSKVLVGAKRFRIYYHITDLGREYLACAIEVFEDIYTAANKILKEI